MPDYPKLDRRVHFDNQSRSFSVRQFLGDSIPLRKRMWKPGDVILDQGKEGRCVVFGWGGELSASPHRYEINDEWCNQHWPLVVAQDRAMGNDYPDGASVLAGAKTMQMLGDVRSYYWGFGLDDVLQNLCRRGPVVLGTNWRDSMYTTQGNGFIDISGKTVGGHCYLACGVWPNHPLYDADVVAIINSWGPDWGINGRGFMKTSDLGILLHEDGEACIPIDRPVRSVQKEEYSGD